MIIPTGENVQVQAGPGRAVNSFINIFGSKGTGKTTLLRQTYAKFVRAGACATFIDTTARNADLAGLGNGSVVTTPEGWAAAVRRSLAQKKAFNVIVQPKDVRALNRLWSLVREIGHQVVAIDEMETYANAQRTDPELRRIISQGRNFGVSLVCTVRLPPELDRQLRALADVQVSFLQQDELYAEVIARDCFKNHRSAMLVMKLPQLHYLQYAGDGELRRGQVDPGKSL